MEGSAQTLLPPTLTLPQLDALRQILPQFLGALDEATFTAVLPHLAWVELNGGEILFQEGAPSDALYLLLSGRLQAHVAGPDGLPQAVGEIGRGESVGEMGVFSGKPRRATVVALRDSVLARVEPASLQAILQSAPALTMHLNRVIIERLQRRNTSQKLRRNVSNIAVVSVSAGLDAESLLDRLSSELRSQGHAALRLTSRSINEEAGRPDAAQVTDDDPDAHYWLVNYLDELESRHALVFYQTDPEPTQWTRRCLRQADEVLLLASASASPDLSPIERACLGDAATRVRQDLVLLHPAGAAWAEGTLGFLARRPRVQQHYHLRQGNQADLGRLARLLSGNAVGLVLSGGGARGLAHIGVFRALEEAGVPIDFFGGSSIGSVLAACMACDWGWQKVISENRPVYLANPTSDFNYLPLVSLLSGRKIDRILRKSFAGRHIEEMWRPFFCISTNYTQVREQVHARGELTRAIRASMAIPGVFPPVVSGNDLLVDGAVFNSLPVDVMARTGVKTILAVDLRPGARHRDELTFQEVPGPWTMLLDRFRPAGRRRYPVPSMLTTLMAAHTLNSEQKRSQVIGDVDVLFNPDVRRFGLLEWKAFDQLVEEGYRHAKEVLAHRPYPFA
jgi:NTE family protein